MGNTSSPYSTFILIALMVFAFYFLIIRPNKKRQQAQQQTMNSLTAGTRVLLTSGLFGTLVEVGEKQAVIELSPGVHLTVLKQAIARAVRDGDEDVAGDASDADDSYDLPMDPDPSGPRSYDSGSFDSRPVDGSVFSDRSGLDPVNERSPEHHTLGEVTEGTPGEADRPRGSSSYQPSNDTDPRSGTNTTPIKD